MTRLGAAAAVLVMVACGKHPAPAPVKDWAVVGFATDEQHPAALLAAGNELAIVDPDSHVRWKLSLADEAEAHSADAIGDVVLVTKGNRLRALGATDGRERWTRTFKEPVKRLKLEGDPSSSSERTSPTYSTSPPAPLATPTPNRPTSFTSIGAASTARRTSCSGSSTMRAPSRSGVE